MTLPLRLSQARWWVLTAAVCGLVTNDHLLKGSGLVPGWLTGKLSDLCGLAVAPAVLVLGLGLGRAGPRVLAHLAVAVVFSAIKLSPAAAGMLERLTSAVGWPWAIWCDPTDLLALPALAIAWWLTAPTPLQAEVPPRRWRLVVLGVGAVACAASGPANLHHASAYLVNRTGAALTVERAPLGAHEGACSRTFTLADLEAIPDRWFRDEDFGPGALFVVQSGGVLPLRSNCPVRVTVGKERRLVLVNAQMTSRSLPNVPETEELLDDRGLLFVTGNQAEPQFRAGAGLALRSISPDWAPLPPVTCAEAAVPPLEIGPLPTRGPARITAKRDLGGGCFGVLVEAAPQADGGGGDAGDAGDGGADGGASDAGAEPAPDAGGVDGGPPLSANQILRFCMPEALFPFRVGDQVRIGREWVQGTGPGDPTLSFVLADRASSGALSGAPLGCGFVREPCGRIWRPRELTVKGVRLTAGMPVSAGTKTYYLARSVETLTPGRNCTPVADVQYLEVDNARQ